MEMRLPTVTPVSKGIGLDRQNRIWVLTFLKQPDRFGRFGDKEDLSTCYAFDIFDTEGVHVFRIPIPNVRFKNFSVYDDRMYLIDSQDQACVYEYKIPDLSLRRPKP